LQTDRSVSSEVFSEGRDLMGQMSRSTFFGHNFRNLWPVRSDAITKSFEIRDYRPNRR
jgi:hypothetical protein